MTMPPEVAEYLLRFHPEPKRYTSADIRAIRKALNESRSTFGSRFLLSFEAIKKYENESGDREPWGAVLVVLQLLEQAIETDKTRRRGIREQVKAMDTINQPTTSPEKS